MKCFFSLFKDEQSFILQKSANSNGLLKKIGVIT